MQALETEVEVSFSPLSIVTPSKNFGGCRTHLIVLTTN